MCEIPYRSKDAINIQGSFDLAPGGGQKYNGLIILLYWDNTSIDLKYSEILVYQSTIGAETLAHKCLWEFMLSLARVFFPYGGRET